MKKYSMYVGMAVGEGVGKEAVCVREIGERADKENGSSPCECDYMSLCYFD